MTVKIPFDYHMHSDLSCDCRTPMAEMCREALRKGIHEIAFTEHLDPKPEDLCAGKYDPDAYFHVIEACRAEFGPQGLTIKAGVEVGEIHLYQNVVGPVLEAYPYDLVLGSLHWNRGESMFDQDYFKGREPRAVARNYFAEMLDMVEYGGFDILSHLDVFKRTAFLVYKHFNLAEYEEYVRPVLGACIRQGITPEINTSALRMPVAQTHPTVEALRWYREMGGQRLTIGSDAHNPSHLGTGLERALDMAREVGFTALTRFARRTVQDSVPI